MSEKKASAAHEETTSSDEPRKKESLTDQITETFSELTESISQVRSNRRRASMPPTDTIPVGPEGGRQRQGIHDAQPGRVWFPHDRWRGFGALRLLHFQ